MPLKLQHKTRPKRLKKLKSLNITQKLKYNKLYWEKDENNKDDEIKSIARSSYSSPFQLFIQLPLYLFEYLGNNNKLRRYICIYEQ